MQQLTGSIPRLAASLLLGLLILVSVSAQSQAAPPSAFGPSASSPAEAPAAPGGENAGSGLIAWVTATQQHLQRELAESVRNLREGNPLVAMLALAGLSFGYGVVHAVGPGHGKVIISSYVAANEETAKRGILVSFLASAVQALTAILLVVILAVALNATGIELRAWSSTLETASYALVALFGMSLLVRQLLLLARGHSLAPADTSPVPADRDAGDHEHHPHDHHAHDHEHHDGCCGHTAPLDRLEGPMKLRQLAAVVFSVGIRPCSGAIVVLVFALAQGLFWAGIAATFAMALGTAITVAAIALLTLGSRELALKLGGEGSAWTSAVWTVCSLGGAALITFFGGTLFLASLGPARPF